MRYNADGPYVVNVLYISRPPATTCRKNKLFCRGKSCFVPIDKTTGWYVNGDKTTSWFVNRDKTTFTETKQLFYAKIIKKLFCREKKLFCRGKSWYVNGDKNN